MKNRLAKMSSKEHKIAQKGEGILSFVFIVSFLAHQRHQQGGYGGSGGMGSSHLFDDTSAEQHGPMPGPGQQYAGVDFLQAPVTNMAFQYGTNMASQGKEYVEKNVSIHF